MGLANVHIILGLPPAGPSLILVLAHSLDRSAGVTNAKSRAKTRSYQEA